LSKRDRIRKNVITDRANLSSGDQQAANIAAATHFMQSELYQTNQRIGFFMAANGEIDPASILNQALDDGKDCYLPTLDPTSENTLIYVNYSHGESLVYNKFRILEPVIQPNNVIGAKSLDLVLVPLVSFDLHGNRLGMGKGYYDRTFAFKNDLEKPNGPTKPLLVGFAYEFQKYPEFNHKPWDVPLDYAVTDTEMYDFT